MENYIQRVRVIKIISYIEKGYEKCDRNLVLRLQNNPTNILDCFEYEGGDFEEGKEYLVKLGLCDFGIERQGSCEKKSVYIKRTPTAVNQYELYGQIVAETKKQLVLDCGFFVFINKPKTLRKGEWIKAVGRLDVFL